LTLWLPLLFIDISIAYSFPIIFCLPPLTRSLHFVLGLPGDHLHGIFIFKTLQGTLVSTHYIYPYHCILNLTNISCNVSTFRSCLMSRFQILSLVLLQRNLVSVACNLLTSPSPYPGCAPCVITGKSDPVQNCYMQIWLLPH